jgi:hypothetical protein
MKIELNDEALEYGRLATRAFESAGGDELIQLAESDPGRRTELVAPVLDQLGAWDLDVRGSADELEAAAALCRSAGYWAAPLPVAERLARPTDLDVDGLFVVADVRPSAPVTGTDLRWAAVDLDGRRSLVTGWSSSQGPRKSGLVAELDLEPVDGDLAHEDPAHDDLALGLVLPCWTLLGMLDRAIELTCGYVSDREQFGQRLSSFQGVQFQLTDAEVERSGVEVLAKYALWSVQERRPEAIEDALALRAAAIEAADVVFRISHQLHGAIGFCDETTLSWLSRYSLPLRRLPLGLAATRAELTRRLGRRGLTGLFANDQVSSDGAIA